MILVKVEDVVAHAFVLASLVFYDSHHIPAFAAAPIALLIAVVFDALVHVLLENSFQYKEL